jgi:glycosyltransferase involved in cell wall biosynthesis
VPAALHRHGRLDCLHTDVWIRPGFSKMLQRIPALRRLSGRSCMDLQGAKVRRRTPLALWRQLLHGVPRDYTARLAEAEEFDRWVAQKLGALRPDRPFGVFAFKTAGLECMQLAAARGWVGVIDQTDAGPMADRIEEEQSKRRPEAMLRFTPRPAPYWERIAREWNSAAAILVNSDWTRRAIAACGAPQERIFVVPLCYAGPSSGQPVRRSPHEPLRLLALGRVSLMKGVLDLADAMARLDDRDIVVDLVGEPTLPASVLQRFPKSMRVRGAVPRSEVSALLSASHALVFPTLSDGFGMVQLEAMGAGLPVVSTWNCADVVEPGVDGWRVPAGDPEALAEAIARLDDDPDQLAAMSAAARRKATQFGPDRWWREFREGLIRLGIEA